MPEMTITQDQCDVILDYLRRHVHRVQDETYVEHVQNGDVETAVDYIQIRLSEYRNQFVEI